MPKFQLKATAVVISIHDLEYEIEAETKEEAERIFRHPNGSASKMSLVHDKVQTRGPTRSEIPVAVSEIPLQREKETSMLPYDARAEVP